MRLRSGSRAVIVQCGRPTAAHRGLAGREIYGSQNEEREPDVLHRWVATAEEGAQ